MFSAISVALDLPCLCPLTGSQAPRPAWPTVPTKTKHAAPFLAPEAFSIHYYSFAHSSALLWVYWYYHCLSSGSDRSLHPQFPSPRPKHRVLFKRTSAIYWVSISIPNTTLHAPHHRRYPNLTTLILLVGSANATGRAIWRPGQVPHVMKGPAKAPAYSLAATASLCISSLARSRSALRKIFPEGFFGIASTNTTPPVSLLIADTLPSMNAIISFSVAVCPDFSTT